MECTPQQTAGLTRALGDTGLVGLSARGGPARCGGVGLEAPYLLFKSEPLQNTNGFIWHVNFIIFIYRS